MIDYKVCKDNIIRDKKNHPKIDNEVFQNLVIKKQKNEMSKAEETLYGQCIMTLVEIILNCPKLKFQKEEVKDDCKLEAYIAICEGLPKYFKPELGSKAYSYAYRIGYTAMIHVLEKNNKYNEMMKTLIETYNDIFGITKDEESNLM